MALEHASSWLPIPEIRSARLIVVAEPRFLGLLRPALKRRVPAKLPVVKLTGELSWRSASSLQRVLVKKGLIPAREAPAGTFRARGQRPVAARGATRARVAP